jgi:hypothetical protein
MSELAHMGLLRAAEITEKMLDAASIGHWPQVVELDAERQPWLRQAHPADARSRDMLMALLAQNRQLLERAAGARDEVERQFDRHKYSHRALNTYMAASGAGDRGRRRTALR